MVTKSNMVNERQYGEQEARRPTRSKTKICKSNKLIPEEIPNLKLYIYISYSTTESITKIYFKDILRII